MIFVVLPTKEITFKAGIFSNSLKSMLLHFINKIMGGTKKGKHKKAPKAL